MRRTGTGLTTAGERVWWSVAEGRRGRRWREAVVSGGGLRHSLLLETSPDRRFSHLELATPHGLLTLHPEADGTLHGNTLDASGLHHVAGLPWTADGLVVVEGSPLAAAAIAHLLGDAVAPGGSADRAVLRIDAGLRPSVGTALVERLDDATWRIDGGSTSRTDADGLPMLADHAVWPLELGPG